VKSSAVEEVEDQQSEEWIRKEYKLSWLAYIRLVIVSFFFSFISMMILSQVPDPRKLQLALVMALIILGFFVYHFLYLRSIVLYTDDIGIWCYSGILPWKKGARGIKWRDLDSAVVYLNFISWLFNSYTICINHRFTKASELFLRNVRRGKEAVEYINTLHSKRGFE